MSEETIPMLLSPSAASRLTGIGANTLRAAARAGAIKACCVGSHSRLFRDSLFDYVANLPVYTPITRGRRTTKRHK